MFQTVRIAVNDEFSALDNLHEELLRPSADERRANPRASSARLRWAARA